MKTKLLKFKEIIKDIIAWFGYWIPIILVISVFIVAAMMVENVIGKHSWIVFVADIVFFYLFWKLLDINYKRQLTFKKRILISLTLLLFLFIALDTLGVAMLTEQRVIINVIIFHIGCFTILAVCMTRKRNAQ